MTPLYKVIDLGALGGVTRAWDIADLQPHVNKTGSVAGESNGQGAFWNDGSPPPIPLGGAMARAINVDGVIVGSRSAAPPANSQAVMWNSQLKMSDLVVPAPDEGAILNVALDINSKGQVVGQGFKNGTFFAFSYDPTINAVTNLFPGVETTNSFANAVNKQGQVVGGYVSLNAGGHPFLWPGPGGDPIPIAPQWPVGEATDINDDGLVVGYFYNTGTPNPGPFSYSSGTGVTQFGLTPSSVAWAVNTAGEIVGGQDFSEQGEPFAWIYNRKILAGYGKGGATGIVEDLNELIDLNAGWTLGEALGINNRGQIVGSGTYGGQQHAFLLVPTGAGGYPIALDITAMARLIILWGIFNDAGGFGYTPGGHGVRVPPYQPVDPLGPWREMLSPRDRRRIVAALLRGAAALADDPAMQRELLAMIGQIR